MGAYSPTPLITQELREKIEAKVIEPILRLMREKGNPYVGFLYAGLMIVEGEPYVLEFNCRLGDPEAQVILPRIKADFLELVLAAKEGRLKDFPVEESPEACVCVVMASKGYPAKYEKGKLITGLEKAEALPGVIVFHAGTKEKEGKFYTNGGRVLGVTALASTLPQAINRAYEAVEKIHFEGAYYRQDIGHKAFRY
jgi:phosphoribosylamine--glycine ligase